MSISLQKLIKRYDDQPVVNQVSLEVKDGEFFVLLGSSGSGKTTILNLIAGLTELDSGRIVLHGRDVTHLPTQERRVGFVFQNYALFQYMTVAENIEFGLSIRKVARNEREYRREELLDLVGLSGLGARMPRQLSGGQQQRVALARALAHKPDVLLLDEPLGALDAKIRIELRRTLRSIQRQLGIATILVTHDQEEAFDLADRIGVMSYGRLLEVGAPEELYCHPQTEFVATFLGSANLLVGRAYPQGIRIGDVRFPAGAALYAGASQKEGSRVQVLFRPEDVALAAAPDQLPCPCLGQADVEEIAFNGAYERLRLRLPPIQGVRAISPSVTFGSETILLDATRLPEQSSTYPLEEGQKTYLGVRRIHAIDHPGLNFLILNDGSMRAQYALELGGQISRMAHARVTVLNLLHGRGPARHKNGGGKKALGAGLFSLKEVESYLPAKDALKEVLENELFDLVVMGFRPQENQELAEKILDMGEHHLLLATSPQDTPNQALVCVTVGEPGKDDIFFTGRLVFHLGAEVSLMTVTPAQGFDAVNQSRVANFLEDGVKTLGTLGVPARAIIRQGQVVEEINRAVHADGCDLLVMGVPLASKRKELSLNGVVGEVLKQVNDRAILLVRSKLIQSQEVRL
ncbi:MAG TPA: ATP-binding cassette domain-containing protein [Levilinea sp.]|nr:ATP-binding cassette domain-containing protein [Levilinea sp.]